VHIESGRQRAAEALVDVLSVRLRQNHARHTYPAHAASNLLRMPLTGASASPPAARCTWTWSRDRPGGGPRPGRARAPAPGGAADPLPPAVQAAIARERRRLGDSSDGDAVPTNNWIECLEQLPWDRRSDAPTDLAQARAALDAGHAGLDDAKGRIVEHLAVCRRNPKAAGAVICLAGPPGVGKTSLA